MAMDPGFRTGCKVALVDETGKYLDNSIIYPTGSEKQVDMAKKEIKRLVKITRLTLLP